MIIVSADKKGNNVIVEFENKEKIYVPLEIYQKHSLYINCNIPEDQKREIETESQKYLIKENSFRYLSIRNHSRFELNQKLIKKKYRKELIEDVVLELTEKGYLDDEKFAKEYYSSKIKRNIGPLKIRSGLYKKGVDRTIVELIENANFDEDRLIDSATKVAEKKYNQLKLRHLEKIKIKGKLYSFLVNKGYSSDIISKVLNNLTKNYE